MTTSFSKCGFSCAIRKLTTVENPQALRGWCESMKPLASLHYSNYTNNRYTLWLFHKVDFRNGKVSRGYSDERIKKFAQRVYPGCDIGLLTINGNIDSKRTSNGNIKLHRDHTYATAKAISVNLGEAVFLYGEPTPERIILRDGDITEFNCKVLHGVETVSPERYSIVFWKLNEQKGFYPL